MCKAARNLLLAEGSWKQGFGVIHGGERGCFFGASILGTKKSLTVLHRASAAISPGGVGEL